MILNFYKYQGTGNDFVLVNDLNNSINLDQKSIAQICDRHFGIGADGLMLVRAKEGFDFEMIYYNSDGNESTMCGNGGRCIVAFAQKEGIISHSAKFWAIDGPHLASIGEGGHISLGMLGVENVECHGLDLQLFTGSPHYVSFKNENIFALNSFVQDARNIRNSNAFLTDGINVNFVRILGEHKIEMRTYERGVEDETLSCGTGAVAAALATHFAFLKTQGEHIIDIKTKGGTLKVGFVYNEHYEQVQLKGPANYVFHGNIEI